MASILPNTDSLQLGRSYTARPYLISGGSSARPIQQLPLPALSFHDLLNSFYEFPVNLLLRRPSYNYCCSGGHRTTTTAAPVAIAQQLLRRLSHNSCSGDYRTRSSSTTSDSTSNFATSSLIECYSPDLPSCLGRRSSFLRRTKLVKPPTEICT